MASDQKPVEALLRANPHFQTQFTDHGDTWMLLRSGVLNIYGNVASHDAKRIGAHEKLELVQTARKFDVSTSTLRLLDEHVLARHPQACLKVNLNGFGAFDDLSFVEYLPSLRSLVFAGGRAIDLRPVRSHRAIEDLGVGGVGTSLRPLHGWRQLRSFGWSERLRHHETIGTLRNLETLRVYSQSLKSLSFLKSLGRLRSLSFVLGGTRHFADLPTFPALAELSIWRTSKLEVEHLFPINQIGGLKRLMLSELPRITTLDWLTNPSLRLLDLDRLRGLHSYTSLEGLPGLETLVLRDRFTAENLAELSRLPNLKTLYVHEYPLNRLRPPVDLESLPFAIRIIDFIQGEFPGSDKS